MPAATHSGFLTVKSDVNRQRDLREERCEIKVCGCVVDWIAADDDQRVNGASLHVGNQLAPRDGLRRRLRKILNGCANISESRIQLRGKRVNDLPFVLPRDNDASPGMRTQISRDRIFAIEN